MFRRDYMLDRWKTCYPAAMQLIPVAKLQQGTFRHVAVSTLVPKLQYKNVLNRRILDIIFAICPTVSSYEQKSGAYDMMLFNGSIPRRKRQVSSGVLSKQQSGVGNISSDTDSAPGKPWGQEPVQHAAQVDPQTLSLLRMLHVELFAPSFTWRRFVR